MKKTYEAPSLIAYGRARDLTLGSTGNAPDYISVNGVLTVNPAAPNCTTNGPPACITIH